jgi:hypothetical protein
MAINSRGADITNKKNCRKRTLSEASRIAKGPVPRETPAIESSAIMERDVDAPTVPNRNAAQTRKGTGV